MKLSIITTITNPDKYQYAWREALKNFCALADEVVVVNGGQDNQPYFEIGPAYEKIKEIMMPWPEQWYWCELPLHLNAGLEAASGDWVLKMDIDYLIRECDFADLRARLEAWQDGPLVVSFIKTIILNRFRCYDKAAVPFCLNKKLAGDSIKFGINVAEKTDWCYPVMVKGKNFDGVPMGISIPDNIMRGVGVRIYDYDYFFRTKEVARSEFWRFAQAYATAFDKSWGETEEQSWEIWQGQYRGRLSKFLMPLALEGHPEAIRERIKNMRPDEFGFDNWGAAKF
jgi:hypothetical protein